MPIGVCHLHTAQLSTLHSCPHSLCTLAATHDAHDSATPPRHPSHPVCPHTLHIARSGPAPADGGSVL